MDLKRLQELTFFPTPEVPCSYLPEQTSRSVFLDPEAALDRSLFQQLNLLGFRRSGAHVYRPSCALCKACRPVRVLVNEFAFSGNHKRLLKRNNDLQVTWQNISTGDEYYALYRSYINHRHRDGDMYPPSRQQFDKFLATSLPSAGSYFLCFRSNNKLVAVSTVDILIDGVSAIYTFFDPELAKRSLGKLAILWLIQWAKQQNSPYVYLGYWVKESRKMAYKIAYQPLEVFNGLTWQRMTDI